MAGILVWGTKLIGREIKKPDSDESGLAGDERRLQPWRVISAHEHRRQADPCQRARLSVVIMTPEHGQS